MKVALDQRPHSSSDDAVERAMVRYKAAHAEYEGVVDKHADLRMTGTRLSELAQLEEERALEALDCAREALFNAAALAFPTVH